MKAWGWEDNAQSKTESRDTKPPRRGERYIREIKVDEKNRESQSYNGPAILELNSASKSLLESDFYRLGHQGQHLHGWASGIVKGMRSFELIVAVGLLTKALIASRPIAIPDNPRAPRTVLHPL